MPDDRTSRGVHAVLVLYQAYTGNAEGDSPSPTSYRLPGVLDAEIIISATSPNDRITGFSGILDITPSGDELSASAEAFYTPIYAGHSQEPAIEILETHFLRTGLGTFTGTIHGTVTLNGAKHEFSTAGGPYDLL